MLSYLRGILRECHPQYAVVEAMGLGFHVLIPASFYFQLPLPGNNVTIYTYLQLKDDGLSLYGFRSNEERDLFKMLLGVTGIGPKAALSLLGHLSLAQLYGAILQEDILELTCIPGIGTKTAKRLIYELKDKLAKQQPEAEAAITVSAYKGSNSGPWQDVQQALIALGYSPQEVQKARKFLGGEAETSVEELFKKTLSFLAQK